MEQFLKGKAQDKNEEPSGVIYEITCKNCERFTQEKQEEN